MQGTENRINDLINIINKSLAILTTIHRTDTTEQLGIKSKKVYEYFKLIVKNINMMKLKPQLNIMIEIMNNISTLKDEFERLKIYQFGLCDLGLSFNNKNFKFDSRMLTQVQYGGVGSDDFNALSQRLLDKLMTMNRLSQAVNDIIDKIMLIIGDITSSDGLINIRIKIEWLINNFKKYYGDSEAARQMFDGLKEISKQIDTNISGQAINKEKLDKMRADIQAFTKDVGTILSQAPNNPQMINAAINKPTEEIQQEGGNNFENHLKISDIDSWLVFFKNIKEWSDDNRLLFSTIRGYYYMIRKACKMIYDRCKKSDYLKKLYADFIDSIGAVEHLMFVSNNNISNVLEAEFDKKNNMEEAAKLLIRKTEPIPLDPNELLLHVLVNNYNIAVSTKTLTDDLNDLKSVHTNLMELYYSLPFIETLCMSLFYRNKLREDISAKLDQQYNKLITLTYRSMLLRKQAEYNNEKRKILQDTYDLCFVIPLEKMIGLKNNLNPEFARTLELYKQNYQDYILGMSYTNNYSQLHLYQSGKKIDNTIYANDETQDNYENTLINIIKIRNAIQGFSEYSRTFNNIMDIAFDTEYTFDTKIDKKLISELASLYDDAHVELKDVNPIDESSLYELIENKHKSDLQTREIPQSELQKLFEGVQYNDVLTNANSMLNALNEAIKIVAAAAPVAFTVDNLRNEFTERKYLDIMTGANDNEKKRELKKQIKSWFDKYNKILLDNKDKFNNDYIKTAIETADDDNERDIKIYAAVMKNVSDEINMIYFRLDIAPQVCGDLELKVLAKSKNVNIYLNDNNEQLKHFDSAVPGAPVANIFIYRDNYNNYGYYTIDNEDKKTELITRLQRMFGGARPTDEIDKYFNLLSQEIDRANASKTRNIKDKLSNFIFALSQDSINKINDKKTVYDAEYKGVKYMNKVNDDEIKTKINTILYIVNNVDKDINERIDNYFVSHNGYINMLSDTYDRKSLSDELKTIKYHITTNKEEIRIKISEKENEIISKLNEVKCAERDVDARFGTYKASSDEGGVVGKDEYNAALTKLKTKLDEKYTMVRIKSILNYALSKLNDLITLIDVRLNSIKIQNISFDKQKTILDTLTRPDANKLTIKQTLEKELIPYDVRKYAESNENNVALVTRFDKILTESINAIKVYVKARDEDSDISPKYNPTAKCLKIGDEIFGTFERIYWSNTNLADLYCGEGINCAKKIPLSKGVRDTTMGSYKSNIYYTEGFSGSGKTTLLLGLGKTSGNEKNATGVISRIIQDVLGSKVITTTNTTDVSIEYMIGEIYGEKNNLSIRDSNFTECLYLWQLGDKIEEIQFVNNNVSDGTNDAHLANLDNIEKSRLIYKNFDPKYDFKFTDFDKAKYITTVGENDATKYTEEKSDDVKKFVNLNGYTPDDKNEYKKRFGLKDSKQLYDMLDGKSKFYKKFSRNVSSNKDIADMSREFTDELNNNINKIQAIRREKNRVRCTKYNSDSSRSHMFFIFRIPDGVDYKYYTFIDKAGNEIPYSIAIDEFSRLAERLDEKTEIMSISNVSKNITSTKPNKEEATMEIMNTLLNELIKLDNIVMSNLVLSHNAQKIDNTIKYTIILSPSNYIEINFKPEINIKSEQVRITISGTAGMQNVYKIDNWNVEYSFKFILGEHRSDNYSGEINGNNIKITIKTLCDIIRNLPNNIRSIVEPNDIYLFHRELSKQTVRQRLNLMILHNPVDNKIKYNKISEFISLLNIVINNLGSSIKVIPFDETLKLTDIGVSEDTTEIQRELNSTTINYHTVPLIKTYNVGDKFKFEQKQIVETHDTEITFKSSKTTQKYKFYLMRLDQAYESYINLYTTLNKIITTNEFDHKSIEEATILSNKLRKQYVSYYKDAIYLDENIKMTSKNDFNETPAKQNIDTLEKMKIHPKKSELNYEMPKLLMKIRKCLSILNIASVIEYLFKQTDKTKNSHLTEQLNALIETFTSNKDAIINRFTGELNKIIGIPPAPQPIPSDKLLELNSFYDKEKDKYNKEIRTLRNKLSIDILETIIRNIAEYTTISAIDETEPTTDMLGIDYAKLLASHYIQRSYFSKLQQDGRYKCNNLEIQKSLNHIGETLSFLFDDRKTNVLTKTFMEQNDNLVIEARADNTVDNLLTLFESAYKTIDKMLKRSKHVNDVKERLGEIELEDVKDYIKVILVTYYINNKVFVSTLGKRNRSYFGNEDHEIWKKLVRDAKLYDGNGRTKNANKYETSNNSINTFVREHHKKIIELCELINKIFEPFGQIDYSEYDRSFKVIYEMNQNDKTNSDTYNKELLEHYKLYVKLLKAIDNKTHIFVDANPLGEYNKLNVQDEPEDVKTSATKDRASDYPKLITEINTLTNNFKYNINNFTEYQKNLIKGELNKVYMEGQLAGYKQNIDALNDTTVKAPAGAPAPPAGAAVDNSFIKRIIDEIYKLGGTEFNKTKLFTKTNDPNEIPYFKSYFTAAAAPAPAAAPAAAPPAAPPAAPAADIENRYINLLVKRQIVYSTDNANYSNDNNMLSIILKAMRNQIAISLSPSLIIKTDGLNTLETSSETKGYDNTLDNHIKDAIRKLTTDSKVLKSNRYDPEKLYEIESEFSSKLPVNFALFKNIKINIRTIPEPGGKTCNILFYGPDDDTVKSLMKTFVNFLVRLEIISNLAQSFAFLNVTNNFNNIINEKTEHLIPLFDYGSLIDTYNGILFNDYDKVTYIKEFEKQFNVKLMFMIQRKTDRTKLDDEMLNQMAREKYIWLNDPYLIWKDLANKLIPIYLLNVRQGFWINHSIRLLMRTLLYNTDDKYIDSKLLASKLFDDTKYLTNRYNRDSINDKLTGDLLGKFHDNDTIINLVKNIRLLTDDIKAIEANQDQFIDDIIKQNQTLEEYYLARYDIKNSIWLKLLITIQHLGANIDPLNYTVPDPGAPLQLLPYGLFGNDFNPIDDVTIGESKYKTAYEKQYDEKKKVLTDAIIKYKNQLGTTISLSRSQVLLLALSTRPDKFEGVKKTIEFSNIITQISNLPCTKGQIGGYNEYVGGFNELYNKLYSDYKTKHGYALRKLRY